MFQSMIAYFLNRNNILKRSNDTTGSALYETSLSAELLAWKERWPLKNVAANHSNWPSRGQFTLFKVNYHTISKTKGSSHLVGPIAKIQWLWLFQRKATLEILLVLIMLCPLPKNCRLLMMLVLSFRNLGGSKTMSSCQS